MEKYLYAGRNSVAVHDFASDQLERRHGETDSLSTVQLPVSTTDACLYMVTLALEVRADCIFPKSIRTDRSDGRSPKNHCHLPLLALSVPALLLGMKPSKAQPASSDLFTDDFDRY